jgi:hydroxyethylthiazole kinase
MDKNIQQVLAELRQKQPLILCLTNDVTMDLMANSLLAMGAAPLMLSDPREFEDLLSIAGSVNVNLGSLNEAFIQKTQLILNLAHEKNVPVILDPVGSGASQLRTSLSREVMKHVDIIKGNASEIGSLWLKDIKTKGVEATEVLGIETIAKSLATSLQKVVVVSGKIDFITNGMAENQVSEGSPWMKSVTGMGCALGAVIAAFRTIVPDSFQAAFFATQYFGRCGTLAAEKAKGPGSFRMHFLDTLACTDWKADSC